uniref:Uncharacterized protein n=1 Tax=Amphimedon queenslandica TaxID=400682 RepID=A0A1X7VK59_AMPQE
MYCIFIQMVTLLSVLKMPLASLLMSISVLLNQNHALALVFYFLPGTHFLNSSIVISSRLNISFQGIGEMKEGPHETVLESPVVIQCAEDVTIEFGTCDNIQMGNLTFKSCGREFNSIVDYFTSSAISITNSVNVTIKYLSIQDSPGGAAAISVSNCQIIHSSFYLNNLNSTDNESSTVTVIFSSIITPRSIHAIFLMNHTNITNNRFIGLIVNPLQNNYNTSIHLNYLYTANNSVANVFVRSVTNLYDLFVTGLKTTGSLNGLVLTHNTLTENEYRYSPSIHMTNCFVSYNQLVGINIAWFSSFSGSLHLNSSTLSHNSGLYGSALLVNTDPFANEQFDIIVHNVTFDRNTISEAFYETLGVASSFIVTIGIFGSTDVVISNCTISNNEGSGLGIIDTYITFYGINIFHNNSAYNGGGIFMISSSFLFLTHGSMLRFSDNHANNSGGAINVQQIVLRVVSSNEQVTNRCFYQLQNNDDTHKYFYFENNTADVAGSVLYGGAMSYCIQGIYRASEHQFTNISKFVNQTGLSIISSDPRKVCFCEYTTPNCNLKSLTVSATPGESVPFIVAVVGQHDNTTTGTVSVSIGAPSNHNISSAVCTNLTQEVIVEANDPDKVTIHVRLTDFETNFFQPPLTINVNVNPCLPGTYLSQQSQVCVCDNNIKPVTTNCNGVTATVTKEGRSWLGVYENCTAINDECPYDYCIHSSITFPLSDPDRQCALNRSGLLCGKCKEGLSLMLGTNKCGDCTNDYLALLIPFLLAGMALVVLLIALNLTVTVGTINGLLFFANVVKIYQPLFFGLDYIPVLSQFISWINLDLGIETCFYAGMNTCAKTGLQFVFPFYLWFLIFLIIMLSRRSSKLSQLIGNNAVPVLCTLLLLSYTKILRTLISIFILVNPVSTCRSIGAVWFNNAEPYLSGCHLVLFIIAFIVLVVLLVPYTLFLLFFPLWELCRSKWSICTSLYLKLKPFFDAYAGPHTDLFRIWPGLLLLARIVIMLSTVVALDPVSEVTLGVLVALTAVLIITMSYVSVYKNKKIQSLDISYLVYLLIICYVIHGSLAQNNGDNSRIFYISRQIARVGIGATLSLSLISFLAIMVYHVYICVPWTKIKRNMRKNKPVQLEDIASESLPKTIVTTTVIPNLREPLLESSAD